MEAYERKLAVEDLQSLWATAQTALVRYGLDDLSIEAVEQGPGQAVELLLSAPEPCTRLHPYLGRLDGRRFLLRIWPCPAQTRQEAMAELLALACLLRDTNLPLPEPVPACDGSLLVRVEAPTAPTPVYCVLFRFAGGPTLPAGFMADPAGAVAPR